MNEYQLEAFRDLADALAGDDPRDWQWVGEHSSQRMFGITQKRAEEYARRFGGQAKQMIAVTVEHGGTVVDRVLVSSPQDVADFIHATVAEHEDAEDDRSE